MAIGTVHSDAEFKFRTVNLGVDNPNYKYDYALPLLSSPLLNGTYSKDLPFRTKEPGQVSIYYDDDYIEGTNVSIEGTLNVHRTTIEDCRPARPLNPAINSDQNGYNLNKVKEGEVIILPNPFENRLVLLNLNVDESYIVGIYNSLGQCLMNFNIEKFDGKYFSINTEELIPNNIYFLSIESNSGISIKKKLIKIK